MRQALLARLPIKNGGDERVRGYTRLAARSLIVAGAAVYCAATIATAVVPDDRFTLGIWVPLPLMALTAYVSYRLTDRSFVLSQLAWHIGLAASVVLALNFARRPEVILALVWLPMMAATVLGAVGGLVSVLLVTVLTFALTGGSGTVLVPTGMGVATVIAGTVGAALGWALTSVLLDSALASLTYAEQMQAQADEARDQRLEFNQTQEDLVRANQELARLSDRLRAMYQVAEEARRAKEVFVANVSHELRTPLNMIIGFSEMIPRLSQVYGGKLHPALLSDIAAIRRNSQHLARLVDDVLDLSQVDSGRMALSREWVNIPDVLAEAALAVHALYEAKGLEFAADLAPDLPQVFCDGTRIRQVVLNLLSNAARFTDRGGVTLKSWGEDASVVVSVTDTGPGIPAEARERIFQPFQQLDSSISRRHGGSGLGLAISRELVQLHGGRMWLESEVGVGTNFYFSLPVHAPVVTGASGDASSSGNVRRWFSPYTDWGFRVRTRLSKAPVPEVIPRIVLLEEGRSLQRLFDRYIEGVEVNVVANPAEAAKELSRSPAQALVVNALLPTDATTSDELAYLAPLPYGTPALRCWVPGGEDAAEQLGVVSYLTKPISSEILLSSLDALGDHVRDVLIVDDEPEALQLFTRQLALSPNDYRVIQATDGGRALEVMRQRQPDVVLLDLVMPGTSGFDVLREKAKDPAIRAIPAIAVSALDPQGEAIVTSALTVTRGGGLSVRDLLTCIEALSQILVPTARPARQVPQETPAA